MKGRLTFELCKCCGVRLWWMTKVHPLGTVFSFLVCGHCDGLDLGREAEELEQL